MTGYCKKEIRNKAVSFGTNPKAVTVSQENSKGVRASEKRAQDLGICLVLKPNLRYRIRRMPASQSMGTTHSSDSSHVWETKK